MKYKKIPPSYFFTLLDRLTRFEPANIRYKRVFDDIIQKYALDFKLKNLSIDVEIRIAEEIITDSLTYQQPDIIAPYLRELENKYFNENEASYQYLSTRLNYSSMLLEIEKSENFAKNVEWLKKISNNCDLNKIRKEFSLLYPIEKIILCEGETEKLLLGTILKLFDIDFDKLGYLLIPAGGKNQVARKFYSMVEYTKLPFFILLDSDGEGVKQLILSKKRENDLVYTIKCGEFEDLIPKELLYKTINYIHEFDIHCLQSDFKSDISTVQNLENIYKKYGFGEFKKALFAQNLKEYIEKFCTKNDFENSEIVDIAKALAD